MLTLSVISNFLVAYDSSCYFVIILHLRKDFVCLIRYHTPSAKA
ncbi:hypothetical protein CZ794_04185 [Psychrobacter sp. JB385]|nr:hypothetical protein CZ794_04185 [Psychrobacter sp. JB385]